MIRDYIGTVKGSVMATYKNGIYKVFSNGFYCAVFPILNCERNKKVYFSRVESEIDEVLREKEAI